MCEAPLSLAGYNSGKAPDMNCKDSLSTRVSTVVVVVLANTFVDFIRPSRKFNDTNFNRSWPYKIVMCWLA
jgi:hypothetical protein